MIEVPANGKWYSFLIDDRANADTGIRTEDGKTFDVSFRRAGQESVVIATAVDYDNARDAAKTALNARKAERAKELIARWPAAIIDIDYPWVRKL